MGPILNTWFANNSEPHYRRATSVALNLIFANSVRSVFEDTIFLLILYPLGRYSEYLELPKQGRTKIQENNDYKPYFVSLRSVSTLFTISYIHFVSFLYLANPVFE